MEESFSYYLNHYVCTVDGLVFLLVTLAALMLVLLLLYAFTLMRAGNLRGAEKKAFIRNGFMHLSEKFYELIFSGGSILFFMAGYYLIDRFMYVEPYRTFWDAHSDLILLGMIVVSILVFRLIDNVLIRLKKLSHEEKAAIRLVGMVYMILIFCYIKFIYEDDNYDVFISYFLGLMIGRFAYFDVSWRDIKGSLAGAVKNLPLMIVALAYLAGLCYFGFGTGFLIKHIGVVTNIFIIHVFTSAAIFLVFHIMNPIISGIGKKKKASAD